MNDQPERTASNETAAPLSFAQQRLWLLDRLIPLGSVYNIEHVLRLSGELDHAALRGALNEVVRRHEVLRTRFGMQDGRPVQVIAPELDMPLPVEDLDAPSAGRTRARSDDGAPAGGRGALRPRARSADPVAPAASGARRYIGWS